MDPNRGLDLKSFAWLQCKVPQNSTSGFMAPENNALPMRHSPCKVEPDWPSCPSPRFPSSCFFFNISSSISCGLAHTRKRARLEKLGRLTPSRMYIRRILTGSKPFVNLIRGQTGLCSLCSYPPVRLLGWVHFASFCLCSTIPAGSETKAPELGSIGNHWNIGGSDPVPKCGQ